MSIPFILPTPLRSVFILTMSPSGDLGIWAALARRKVLLSILTRRLLCHVFYY